MRDDKILENKEMRNVYRECNKIISVIKNDGTEMKMNERLH